MSELDDISALLASVPTFRCPQGHGGSFTLYREMEAVILADVSVDGVSLDQDNNYVTAQYAEGSKWQLKCETCKAPFDIPEKMTVEWFDGSAFNQEVTWW